jgi:hypothetical protein
MCDYSLHGVPSRLAVRGDELVVHRFETATIGLAAAADLERHARPTAPGLRGWLRYMFAAQPRIPAVCVPPGAMLLVHGIPKRLQCEWRVGDEATVGFTQISAAAYQHRDALRLPNGLEILLQHLYEGMHLRVLSLGGSDEVVDLLPEDFTVSPISRGF